MKDGEQTMSKDGISLRNAAHPTLPWWRRMLFWFRRPELSDDVIETVEIDPSRASKTGFKIGGPKL